MQAPLLGCLRDPSGLERGNHIGGLLGPARDEAPPEWSLRPYVEAGLTQRGESCVGAALSHGLRLAARVGGWDIDPSYQAIYTIARMLEHPYTKRLPDVGCYPHRAIEALEDWGVVSAKRWPDRLSIEEPVAIDVLEAGSIARVTGVWRVEDEGEALIFSLKRAIVDGHGVFYAGPVGPRYRGNRGELYAGDDVHEGDHARLLVGYREGAFMELNSWGLGWGEAGFGWISEGYLRTRAYGFTVITAAPSELR